MTKYLFNRSDIEYSDEYLNFGVVNTEKKIIFHDGKAKNYQEISIRKFYQ